VQEGTTTASIPPTSAVVSSTLAPTTGGSKTTSGTGTGTSTGTGTNPTKSSGASGITSKLLTVGAAVGFVVAAL